MDAFVFFQVLAERKTFAANIAFVLPFSVGGQVPAETVLRGIELATAGLRAAKLPFSHLF